MKKHVWFLDAPGNSAAELSIAYNIGTVTSSIISTNGLCSPAFTSEAAIVDPVDVLHALPSKGLVFGSPGYVFGMHGVGVNISLLEGRTLEPKQAQCR